MQWRIIIGILPLFGALGLAWQPALGSLVEKTPEQVLSSTVEETAEQVVSSLGEEGAEQQSSMFKLRSVLRSPELELPDSTSYTYIVQNEDTTYVLHNPEMDSVFVTVDRLPERSVPEELQRSRQVLSQNNPLYQLVEESEMSSGVSRLTADIYRDLPSMVRFYTPEGVPMVVKYTSNNSLTATLPNSAMGFDVKEPSASYPSPDAPVILSPVYNRHRTLSLTPFKQTLGAATGTDRTMATGFSLEHSGAPNPLERLVPELETFSTTYSMFGTVRASLPRADGELTVLHSRSDNEFGDLIGIEHLQEEEDNWFINLHGRQSIGSFALHGGITHQAGSTWQEVQELDHYYITSHEVSATTLTSALELEQESSQTNLRVNVHQLMRTYDENRYQLDRVESVVSHRQELSSVLMAGVETRYDHRDHEPSFSGDLAVEPLQGFQVLLNAGHLYDAVGSEAISSSFRNAQIAPHAWTTRHARAGLSYRFSNLKLEGSLMRKHVELGWYEHSATIDGWTARLGISSVNPGERITTSWRVEGIARDLELDTPENGTEFMPGPARLEGHASFEIGTGRFQYTVKGDLFVDRRQIVRVRWTEDLGSQYFLSAGVSASLSPVQLGLSLDNMLAFWGVENRMAAYNVGRQAKFVSAPPVPTFSMSVEF